MPIDAAGVRHPYLFSTVTDPVSGLSFTPVSGTAVKTKFRVEGPGVPANTFFESHSAHPRMLAAEYRNHSMAMTYGY